MRTKSLLLLATAAFVGTLSVSAGDTGIALPFIYSFNDEASFYEDWTSVAGPDADVTDPWEYIAWDECATFIAEGLQEDNWLISPALYFHEAGTYKITTVVATYGKMEVVLGTDPDDFSTFSQVVQTLEEKSWYDGTTTTEFEISEAGTFHVAFHACADYGDWAGETVYSIVVSQVGVTIPPKELPYVYDFANGVLFDLEWTSLAGKDADTNNYWHYNDYGYAAFEAPNKREDNWLISPPLIFPVEGKYSLSTVVEANGKIEVCIGTDLTDPDSFDMLIFSTTSGSTYNDPETYEFDIKAPGTYYVGFHACAEVGDDWYGEYVAYCEVELKSAVSGLQSVEASNGTISYNNGVVRTSEVAESIKAFAADGRVLTSTYNSDVLSLSAFDHQIVIVVAVINGQVQTFKVAL